MHKFEGADRPDVIEVENGKAGEVEHHKVIKDIGGILILDEDAGDDDTIPAVLTRISSSFASMFFENEQTGRTVLLLATDATDDDTIFAVIIIMVFTPDDDDAIFTITENGFSQEEAMLIVLPVDNCSGIELKSGDRFYDQPVTLRWTNGRLFAMARGMRW